MKRIILTENQIRKVIGNLVMEATPGVENKEINISSSFVSGEYELKSTQFIDDAIAEITKMFPQGSKINVTIESSESKVTNYINGVPVPIGTLSKYRADIIKKYLDGKKLPNFIFTIKNMGAQGDNYVKNVDNPRDKKYLPYQYVKLKINASKETPYDETCLINLQISVNFEKSRGVPHRCDDALFMLTANGVPIKNVERGDNIIDLNNNNDGGDRFNTLVITSEDAKKIITGKNDIKIAVYCMSDLCHSDPLFIGIKNGKNEEVMAPKFITIGKQLNRNEGKYIMTLDSCGKVIQADLPTADELKSSDVPQQDKENTSIPEFKLQPKKRTQYADDRDSEEYTEQSLAQIYKFVHPQRKTIEFKPEDMLGAMRGFKKINHITWNLFRLQNNISDTQQVALDNYMVKNNLNNSNLIKTQSNPIAKQK